MAARPRVARHRRAISATSLVDICGCGVVHVDDAGLMASIDEYWNQVALLRQLGPSAIVRSGARLAIERARALTAAGAATLRLRTGR